MLKKSARLDRTSFSLYFNKGKRTHGSYTTIVTSPAEGFRCAVVVGKKVSKKAPVRNSIRRRIYALVEKMTKEKTFSGVCIIITKPSIARLSRKAFTTSLTEEVGRALN